MGFQRYGAVRHCTCLETLHDGLHRLNLTERNRLILRSEFHDASKCMGNRCIIYHGAVFLKPLVVPLLHCLLQCLYGLWSIKVFILIFNIAEICHPQLLKLFIFLPGSL